MTIVVELVDLQVPVPMVVVASLISVSVSAALLVVGERSKFTQLKRFGLLSFSSSAVVGLDSGEVVFILLILITN